MREIKFRAFDNGIMESRVWLKESDLGQSWHMTVPNFGASKELSSNAIIMQYTGLKDKNCKEIYENDIAKDSEGTGIVVFDGVELSCGWGFTLGWTFNPINNIIGYPNHSFDECEIIGNIFEHPELLKK